MSYDQVSYGANYKDWRFRIRSGIDCTTSATGNKSKIEMRPWRGLAISFSHNYAPGFTFSYSVFGNYCPPLDSMSMPAYSQEMKNKALTIFVRKARQVQHRFQSGVFLGELSQTIRLLKRPLTGFRQLTSNYHERVFRRAHRLKDADLRKRPFREFLSNEWLSYRFGVLPLLSDIDDSMYDLASLAARKAQVQKISSKFGDERLFFAEEETDSYLYWYRTKRNVWRLSESITIRGNVRCLMPELSEFNGSDTLVSVMSDFIPTVWELIPYSFLVDYFSNVGDVISGLTFMSSTVNWANSTQRQTMRVVNERSFVLNPTSYPENVTPLLSESHDSARADSESTRFSRQIVTHFVPSLNFSVPGVGEAIKWANMAALLGASRSARKAASTRG